MRKRSSYRPRQVIPDTLYYIKQGQLPASAAVTTMTRVRIANHGAMTALMQGKGTAEDVTALCHMLVTAIALSRHQIGIDWQQELQQANEALQAVVKRGGKYIMKAAEILALNLALEVHDAQLDGCTVAQLEKAIVAAKAAIKCGHEVKELV